MPAPESVCRWIVGCLLLLLTASVRGQNDDSAEKPGPTHPPGAAPRMPAAVQARTGMVTSAHPLASRAGVAMLQAGGNAIDALLATQMVLNVVEPSGSGIGGGTFVIYHDAKLGKTSCLDGREEVPAAARRADYLDESGKVRRDAHTGGLPVGVPGTVAVLWEAHKRWGRLPIKTIVEPAIRLAEEGTGVTPRLRASIVANRNRFLRFPSSTAAFLTDSREAPEIGSILKQPDLAATFRLLVAAGPSAFYEGEIARDLVRAVREAPYQPGRLELEDLRNYRPLEREPIRIRYRGHEIVSMPPPSSGGITLGIMLAILEGLSDSTAPAGSIEDLDRLARAGAIAFADRNAWLGDADWSPELDVRALLGKDYLLKRVGAARSYQPGQKALPGPLPAQPGRPGGTEGMHTTHISIVDGERNVVSCTTTIEHWMGSALVVPGRGFVLNNQLTDFDLDLEKGPNALDASRRPRITALGDSGQPGGKRPRSSMTPVIVFKDGKPYLTVGSPGGPYIIGVVAEIVHHVLDHGMDIQAALNAPRLSSQNKPLELEWLHPRRAELIAELQKRGWQVRRANADPTFGNAHGIRIRPDGTLEGGADPRMEGAARGY